MKKAKMSAILTMIISLLISIVSGYCTIIGMGKVFASAAAVTMGIAAVIEIGRVILLYDLHHFWNKLKWFQKIPGVLMLIIAMTLSAMGVYGFFANAHSQKAQQVVPIEMVIKQKQSEIQILNEAINVNNAQLKQFDNKAFDRYTEMGYVTKAVNLQKEQQKITNNLYDDNRKKQEEITKLNQEITQLQLEIEQKAPTLAHLKYYAKLFNVDDETAVIIFIVMIMTVFDTLAMYLMITSDWISQLDIKENEKIKNNIENKSESLIKFDENLIEKLKQIIETNKNDPIIIDNNSDDIKELKSMIKSINTQPDLSPIIEKVDSIKSSFNNEKLINKLTEIENKINKNNMSENIDELNENDVLLDKIITSIDENEEVINSDEFKRMLKNNSEILEKLKKLYIKVPSVMNKLNKI